MKPKPKPTQSKRRKLAKAIADMLYRRYIGITRSSYGRAVECRWRRPMLVQRIEQLLKKHGI